MWLLPPLLVFPPGAQGNDSSQAAPRAAKVFTLSFLCRHNKRIRLLMDLVNSILPKLEQVVSHAVVLKCYNFIG
jgi:hypothetical protein